MRVDVLSLGFDGDRFSLSRAAEELHQKLGHSEAVICGLSYGAVIAAEHAISYPGSSHRYVLAGLQTKTRRGPGRILRIAYPLVHQFMQMRSGRRLSRAKVRSMMSMYARLDLRDRLSLITSPVLLMTGRLDRVHFRPARDVLARVPQSEFVDLAAAGHESNKSAP
ncbi:hypothetical protein GCM10009771_10540 [Nesterenkonia flava]